MTSQGLLLSQCAPAKILPGSSFISSSGREQPVWFLRFSVSLAWISVTSIAPSHWPLSLVPQPDVVAFCLKMPPIRSLL